ncbi:Fic family protein [Vibrio parahaemolyticus]|nr:MULTISPECIES: Fic family protein [Vibrio]MCA2421854.1 Fic family protein [Vibrio alginolyticus]MCA2446538.1 Fic family protein [Vibrio alginolyticus]MCR9821584.1 Fic family protein [Vibrio parahaemolyticus]MDF5108333.1 Fic family protein [Vibrio parahaemolyticus]MDF5143239.1 Fic family protein [Vibrio parahaemolyticus]
MAKTGNEKLAEALREASAVRAGNIVNSSNLKPTTRTLLVSEGYLKQIVRGWYLFDADITVQKAGESALWYQSIWQFVGQYLQEAYGDDYWLNPEASIDIHTANNSLPKQLVVFTSEGATKNIVLPNDMSLMVIKKSGKPTHITEYQGVRVLTLEFALAGLAPTIYRSNPLAVQIALGQSDVNAVADSLLVTKNVQSANRLIGAYLEIGRKADSRNLTNIITAAGLSPIKGENPFEVPVIKIGNKRQESAAAVRVRLLWQKLREDVERVFTDKASTDFFKSTLNELLDSMDKVYVSDAYHSLSIEGYVVTEELINRVANGEWDSEHIAADKQQRDALAARGYYEAFQALRGLIQEAHEEGAEDLDLEYLIDVSITQIYTSLFKPCVTAGIINERDLAGYRKGPIMIRTSRHMPPQSEHLMDCMDALKELIVGEPNFVVKAVLGHFFLGYVHPFPDGNGRTSRFLMNFMFLLGGYRWTVVPVTERTAYLDALESASIDCDVVPFAKFLHNVMPD